MDVDSKSRVFFFVFTDKLTVIDYDTVDRNYEPFDLGIYLSTCAGMHSLSLWCRTHTHTHVDPLKTS